LSVNWGSSSSCMIQIPKMIPQGQLLLPCLQKPE
jgi:outer membrane usher protein PapC